MPLKLSVKMKSCAAIRYMLLPLVARKENQELLKTNTFYRLKHSPCSDLGIEFVKLTSVKIKSIWKTISIYCIYIFTEKLFPSKPTETGTSWWPWKNTDKQDRQELEIDAKFMAPSGLIGELSTFLKHLKSTASADDFFKWKENIILFYFLWA